MLMDTFPMLLLVRRLYNDVTKHALTSHYVPQQSCRSCRRVGVFVCCSCSSDNAMKYSVKQWVNPHNAPS